MLFEKRGLMRDAGCPVLEAGSKPLYRKTVRTNTSDPTSSIRPSGLYQICVSSHLPSRQTMHFSGSQTSCPSEYFDSIYSQTFSSSMTDS
jgi:hypothetical protein